jgi:hypothetical protein
MVINACDVSAHSVLSILILSKNVKTKYRYNFAVVSYGCETSCHALTEGNRLKLFENRLLLWRIFGHKTDEVTGGWRKLHNEELHNL